MCVCVCVRVCVRVRVRLRVRVRVRVRVLKHVTIASHVNFEHFQALSGGSAEVNQSIVLSLRGWARRSKRT